MARGLYNVIRAYRYAAAGVFGLLLLITLGGIRASADVAGQVGNAPRCTVNAVGARAKAFHPSGNSTTVQFTVSGANDCKVQLSANSFYAPTMDGRPYDKQVLYQRATTTFKTGTHSMTVGLPTNGSAAKGCYYQVDLTYGIHNVTPVLAYDHGKTCKTQPTPTPTPTPQPQAALACASLTEKLVNSDENMYTFTAAATASNTAITSYVFNFGDGNSQTVTTSQSTASTTHGFADNSAYNVQVMVNGAAQHNVTSANCKVNVTTTKQVAECKPGVPEGSAECNPQPAQPSNLPNTGAGDVVGFFGLAVVAGGLLHHFFVRRKITP